MPHAIIRGKNGRRHEVDFGDAPVRVEIYASDETVEIFVEADFETHAEERRRFAILNIPRNLFSEASGAAARRRQRAASKTAWIGDGRLGRRSCPLRQESRPPKRKPWSGGDARVSETDDQDLGDVCDRHVDRTVGHDHEFRLHDRRGGTSFSARIRIGNPRWPRFPARPDQGMARRELRSKQMGDEKSGVGAVSIRRREAVVPFRGPGSRETYEPSSIIGTELSTNRPFARERSAGVVGDRPKTFPSG